MPILLNSIIFYQKCRRNRKTSNLFNVSVH